MVNAILRVAGLLAVIALAACATVLDEDGALAVAPYRIQENGRIVVDVHVNEHGPYTFALDTGATISVIFDELRDELSLELVPGKVLRIHGLVGSGTFPFANLESLAVGPEIWTTPRVALLPGDTAAGAGIDGILGLDFLRRYAVGLSTRDRVVRLYPPDLLAHRTYRGWSSVPLNPELIGESGAALYLFEITIGEHTIAAIFDLGAGLNLINHAAAQRIGIETALSRARDVVTGAIESTPVMARFTIDEISTGNVRWHKEEFRIAELELFTSLMQGDTPYALLGAGLFLQRDFIIDFPRNRLLVKVSMDELEAPHDQVPSPGP